MDTVIDILLLVIGFVFLIKGADVFVDGSSHIAKRLKVPSIIVGLTIVAMGTSFPEMSVSITASIKNENAMALSNAVGSNIFNLLIVLGVCAIVSRSVKVDKSVMKKEFPLSIAVSALLLIFSLSFAEVSRNIGVGFSGFRGIFNTKNGGVMVGGIGHIEGIILLIIFAVYIAMSVSAVKKGKVADEETGEIMPVFKSVLFIIAGAVLICIGGDIVVDRATNIALAAGISETLVGLTIVALGTSLPELVTSIVAARKGETDLAVGNVVGSNIFNIMFVLGVAAAISPVAIIAESVVDIIVLIVVSIIALALCKSSNKLTRREGTVMVSIYIAYLIYIIFR